MPTGTSEWRTDRQADEPPSGPVDRQTGRQIDALPSGPTDWRTCRLADAPTDDKRVDWRTRRRTSGEIDAPTSDARTGGLAEKWAAPTSEQAERHADERKSQRADK